MACLETSFLVDILRGNKEAHFLMQSTENKGDNITIAAPAVMELISGAQLNHIPKERERINKLITHSLILPLNEESAIIAGEIGAQLVIQGETIDAVDIMIGAIAKHNNETLITRNKKHFEKIPGLKIESY